MIIINMIAMNMMIIMMLWLLWVGAEFVISGSLGAKFGGVRGWVGVDQGVSWHLFPGSARHYFDKNKIEKMNPGGQEKHVKWPPGWPQLNP